MSDVVEVSCPTCGEPTAVGVDVWDLAEGAGQGTVVVESDCQVCCRPFHATVYLDNGRIVGASAEPGW